MSRSLARYEIHSHRLGFELLPEVPEFVGRRFRNMASFFRECWWMRLEGKLLSSAKIKCGCAAKYSHDNTAAGPNPFNSSVRSALRTNNIEVQLTKPPHARGAEWSQQASLLFLLTRKGGRRPDLHAGCIRERVRILVKRVLHLSLVVVCGCETTRGRQTSGVITTIERQCTTATTMWTNEITRTRRCQNERKVAHEPCLRSGAARNRRKETARPEIPTPGGEVGVEAAAPPWSSRRGNIGRTPRSSDTTA